MSFPRPPARLRGSSFSARPLASALLLVALLVGCAPPMAQPRLADGSIAGRAHSPEKARDQARQYSRMARAALASGDLTNGAALFEQALLVDGGDADAAIGYGDALLRLGRPHDASEVYARAFGRGGAPAHQGYARAMVALGRPEAAVEHLEKARTLAPRDPAVLNALGVARDMLGQHGRAAKAYKEGLDLAPDDVALQNNLGLSLALAGDADAAIATLRRLAEGARSDKRARQNLALAYGLKGDLAAAERLSRIDLDEEEVRNNLAVFEALRDGTSAAAARALAAAAVAAGSPPVRQIIESGAVRRSPPPDPLPLPPAAPNLRQPAPPPVPSRAAPPSPSRKSSRTVPRGPIPLTDLALGAGDLADGASAAGSWLLDLGRLPDGEDTARRWDELRRKHPDALGGLMRLAGAGGAAEPFLVGPVSDEAAALAACAKLREHASACTPVRL